MAKRKNSTALFEVMAAHRARQAANGANGAAAAPPPRTSAAPPPGTPYKTAEKPGIFSAGKKWIATMLEKRAAARAAAAAAAAQVAAPAEAADPNDPTAGITAQSLVARRSGAIASEPAEVPVAADAESSNGPVTYTTVMPTYGRSSDGDSPRSSRNQVAFDRDKHQVTLRVRFNTAIISLTALLVVVGAAYIIGKRSGKPASAGAAPAPQPAPQVAPQPKQPSGGVFDVGSTPRQSKPAARPPKPGDPTLANDRIPAGRDPSAGLQPSAAGGPSSGQLTPNPVYEDAAIENGSAKRTVGLNYAIIQRFKPEKQEEAQEVSDFLNAHGVPNTIEPASAHLGMTTDGCAIVGTRGFTPRFGQTTEFKEYEKTIEQVAQSFPKKNKIEGRSPEMRKWTE